jgi:hypothetical protein
MDIAELFQKLSYGELSNLAMSGEGSGEILEAYHPKIVLYTNEGLTRLHSRFPLKENDVLVEMHSHITNYHLLPRFSRQHEPKLEKTCYILDLPLEPFVDEVIKVTAVYNTYGERLPLNNDNHPESVFTPQAKVLQVPRPQEGAALSIVYQTMHETLDHTKLNQPISLPDTLVTALTAYIAYKVYSHINTAEASSKAQEHYAFYESVCGEVIEHDLVSATVSTSNTRFYNGGWK